MLKLVALKCLPAEASVIRLQENKVTCGSESTAWCPFLLLVYQEGQFQVPYLVRVLEVMKKYFTNGGKVYHELYRYACLLKFISYVSALLTLVLT
jgi:hypothetical protein